MPKHPIVTLAAAALALVVCGRATARGTGDAPETPETPKTKKTDESDKSTRGKIQRIPTQTTVATRSTRPLLEAPHAVEVLEAKRLLETPAALFPETLAGALGVSAQKTANGMCSPFVRGMTGYRTLLTLDGVRLNTSVLRSGPNEYWNLLDTYALSGVEILRGPSSVLYGSDAMGGTVAARTHDPFAMKPGVRSTIRAAGADRSLSLHVRSTARADSTALTFGVTHSDSDDLVTGRHVGLVHETGFSRAFCDARLDRLLSDRVKLSVVFMYGELPDVPRTHKTIYAKSWYRTSAPGNRAVYDYNNYRSLAYLRLTGRGGGFLDSFEAIVSWQSHTKNLVQRKDGSSVRGYRGFNVVTAGVSTSARSRATAIGTVTAGAEFYRDGVDSWARDVDTAAGTVTERPRGDVADDSDYTLAAVFAQDELDLGGGFEAVIGLRWSRARVHAGEVDPDPGDAFDYDSFSRSYGATVGAARLLWKNKNWALLAGYAGGFRAPNLDDVTSFKDVASNSHDVPAPDVDPEYCHAFEIGGRHISDACRVELFYFYTHLDDFIERTPTTYAGQATDPDGRPYYAKTNFSDGYIHGAELSAETPLRPLLLRLGVRPEACGRPRLRLRFAWTEGYGETRVGGGTATRPLRRTPPTQAVARLLFRVPLKTRARDLRLFVEFVRVLKQDKLSPGDEKDTDRIPPGGTPGYYLLNVGGSCPLGDGSSVSLQVQNVTNRDWRVHGSGLNGPGTNVVLTLTVRF